MSGSIGSAPGGATERAPEGQALDLAVHAAPGVADLAAAQAAARTRAGRIRMLFVLAVCAAPVVASYLAFFIWRPAAIRSFGELVVPTRSMPAVDGVDLQGVVRALSGLRGQWLLVSVGGGACDALCERQLFLQRQLREALGKEKERVDWVWFVNDKSEVRPQLLPALTQATVLRVDGAVIGKWLAPQDGRRLEEHLYVVDPMGEWMMRFPVGLSNSDASRAKRDLERVLRASASWDRPGR